jgi:hypothetical protein
VSFPPLFNEPPMMGVAPRSRPRTLLFGPLSFVSLVNAASSQRSNSERPGTVAQSSAQLSFPVAHPPTVRVYLPLSQTLGKTTNQSGLQTTGTGTRSVTSTTFASSQTTKASAASAHSMPSASTINASSRPAKAQSSPVKLSPTVSPVSSETKCVYLSDLLWAYTGY